MAGMHRLWHNKAFRGVSALVSALIAIQAAIELPGWLASLGDEIGGDAVVRLVLVIVAFAVALLAIGPGRLATWKESLSQGQAPVIVVYDPETHYATLATGELFAAVKVPFANVKDSKTGKGLKAAGFYAEFRVLDSEGHAPWAWTQARWDEVEQQHQRPPGASLTSPEVRTIDLDPNGLKHFMETVIQVQGVPPDGEPRVLEPWTQAGRSGVGVLSPVTVEVRWEGNEIGPESRRMRVEASEPPGLNPQGEWID